MTANLHSRSSSLGPPLFAEAPWQAVCALVLAALAGWSVSLSAPLTVAGVAAAMLVGVVIVRPAIAAYSIILVTPLIVGLQRGAFISLLRPNEVLLLVLVIGVVARRVLDYLGGRDLRIRFRPVDASILALAVTGSIAPLLWMISRGQTITLDDLLYAVVLWKYYALFLLVRTSVRTEKEVERCLWLSLGVAAFLAVLGILQSLKLFGVPSLLAAHYVSENEPGAVSINRATVTFGASLAMADVMIFNLAIAAGLLTRTRGRRGLLLGLLVLMAFGCFASGQVGGVIGLIVGVLAVGLITRRLRTAVAALLPFIATASIALYPVVHARLSDIDRTRGLPESWLGRWHILQTYFLPHLRTVSTLAFGVRPAARVPAPETLAADWVYVESGYVWLVWTGGLLMLVVFFLFLRTAIRATARIARQREGVVPAAAIASFTALCVLAVETVFDPHLTFRGSADLSFSLLALTLSCAGPRALAAGITTTARTPTGSTPTRLAPTATLASRGDP